MVVCGQEEGRVQRLLPLPPTVRGPAGGGWLLLSKAGSWWQSGGCLIHVQEAELWRTGSRVGSAGQGRAGGGVDSGGGQLWPDLALVGEGRPARQPVALQWVHSHL